MCVGRGARNAPYLFLEPVSVSIWFRPLIFRTITLANIVPNSMSSDPLIVRFMIEKHKASPTSSSIGADLSLIGKDTNCTDTSFSCALANTDEMYNMRLANE